MHAVKRNFLVQSFLLLISILFPFHVNVNFKMHYFEINPFFISSVLHRNFCRPDVVRYYLLADRSGPSSLIQVHHAFLSSKKCIELQGIEPFATEDGFEKVNTIVTGQKVSYKDNKYILCLEDRVRYTIS